MPQCITVYTGPLGITTLGYTVFEKKTYILLKLVKVLNTNTDKHTHTKKDRGGMESMFCLCVFVHSQDVSKHS